MKISVSCVSVFPKYLKYFTCSVYSYSPIHTILLYDKKVLYLLVNNMYVLLQMLTCSVYSYHKDKALTVWSCTISVDNH